MLFWFLFCMFTYSYRVNECCVHNVHSQNILMCFVNCILLYIVLLYCVLNIYVIVQLFLVFFNRNMNIWNDMIKSIIDLYVMRQLLASTYTIYFWCHTKCHINRVSQQFVFVSPLVLPEDYPCQIIWMEEVTAMVLDFYYPAKLCEKLDCFSFCGVMFYTDTL